MISLISHRTFIAGRVYRRILSERWFSVAAPDKQVILAENYANFPSLELYYKHIWNKASTSNFITDIEFNTFMNMCTRPYDILYVKGLTFRLESIVQDFNPSMADSFIAACIRLGHPEVASHFLSKWSCRIGSWTSTETLTRLLNSLHSSRPAPHLSIGDRLSVLSQLSSKGVGATEEMLVAIVDEYYEMISPPKYSHVLRVIRQRVVEMRKARGMVENEEKGEFLDPLKPQRQSVSEKRTSEQYTKLNASRKKIVKKGAGVAANAQAKTVVAAAVTDKAKPASATKAAATPVATKVEAKPAGKAESKPAAKGKSKTKAK